MTATGTGALSATARRAIARRRLAATRIAPADTGGAAVIADTVRSLLAMQAQDLASGYWSVGVRTGASLADVEAAVEARLITRSWPMRGTLHFVDPEDLRWMLQLTAPRTLASATTRRTRVCVPGGPGSRSPAPSWTRLVASSSQHWRGAGG